MIKIIAAKYLGDYALQLTFSDGEQGTFRLDDYLRTHHGPLLSPLANEDYARRFFISAGALCWPNGLELSPERLYGLCLVTGAA